MNCPTCDFSPLPDTARFCPNCGSRLAAASAMDFSAYISERTRDFVGREWVFAEIERWLADPAAPRYFILTGEPGIGKTALAARLTQIRDVAAAHFCIARRADTLDPLNFARSLSHQLTRMDEFATCLLEEQGTRVEVQINVRENYGQIIGLSIENLVVQAPLATTAFNRAVLDPLNRLYAGGFKRNLVILIDALDEAVQQPGLETIVDLLANADGLPAPVRFVLTSHPDTMALRHFEQQPGGRLLLDAVQEENLRDVQEYILRQLDASEALLGRLAEQRLARQEFMERVTAASQGNFLYLAWLLAALAEGTQPLEALEALPKGLDGIYREFLRTRVVGKDIDRWRDRYRPVLGTLAAARAPLTIQQLRQFTRLTEQQVKDCLLDAKQFLEPVPAAQKQYQLYHHSITTFLSDEVRAGEFWIELGQVHREIAAYYLEQGKTDWGQVDDYGLLHLAAHLHALRDDQAQRQALYGLAGRPFRDAKLMRGSAELAEVLGNDRSFLADLELVIDTARGEDVATGLIQIVRAGFISAVLRELAGAHHEVIRALSLLGGRESVALETIQDPVTAARVLLDRAGRLAEQKGGVDQAVLDVLQEALQRVEEIAEHHHEVDLRRQIGCLQARADLELAVKTAGTEWDVLAAVLREGARHHPEKVLAMLRQPNPLPRREIPGVYAAAISGLIERKSAPEMVESVVREGVGQAAQIPEAAISGLADIARALAVGYAREAGEILRKAEGLLAEGQRDRSYAWHVRSLVEAWAPIDWQEAERLAGGIQDPVVAALTWISLGEFSASADRVRAEAAYRQAEKWARQIDPEGYDMQSKNLLRQVAIDRARLEGSQALDLAMEDLWGEGRRQGDLTVMLRNFARTLTSSLPDDDREAYPAVLGAIERIPDRYRREGLQVLGNASALLAEGRPRLARDLLAETLRRQAELLRSTVRERLGNLQRATPGEAPPGWPRYQERLPDDLGGDAWRWMDAITLAAKMEAAGDVQATQQLLAGLEGARGLPGVARAAVCQLLSQAYGDELEEYEMPGLIGDDEARSGLGAGLVAYLLESDPDGATAMAQGLPPATSGRVEALARMAAHQFKRDAALAQTLLEQARQTLEAVESFRLGPRAISHLARHWAKVDPQVGWQLADLQPDDWEPDIPEDDYPYSSRITVEEIVAAMADRDLEEAMKMAGIYPQFYEHYLAIIAGRVNERSPEQVKRVVARMADGVTLGRLAARFLVTNPRAALEALGQAYPLELDTFFEMVQNSVSFLPDEQSGMGKELLTGLAEAQAFLADVELPLVQRLRQTPYTHREELP